MAGNTEERSKPAGDKVPAAGSDASMGSGTRTILSTMPEVRDASLKVAKSAQRLLSIFTQDLEPLIYGEEPFLEAIKRLVLARSYAKVRVLLADPSRAMVDNNRFLALARRLTSCIDHRRRQGPGVPAAGGPLGRNFRYERSRRGAPLPELLRRGVADEHARIADAADAHVILRLRALPV
jgi:hypothetical protein